MEKNSQFYRKKLSDLNLNQTKLQTEDNTLLHEESPLRSNLTTALEKLAMNDPTQDHIIDEIKKKLKPIERRREGIASLLERGRNEISRTIEELEKTELKEKADCDLFIAQKRQEKIEELKRESAKREDRLKELWLDFCCQLGERMVDEIRTGESLSAGFMARVADYPREQGYPKCNLPGFLGQFLPHAVLKNGTQKGGVNPLDVAKSRDEADKVRWTEQFEETLRHKEKGN